MQARIALVTGASGGLGTAICQALRAQGHTVIGVDRAPPPPATADPQLHTRMLDITDDTACQALVQELEGSFGSVDILVNNAGITRDATLRKMQIEDWDAVLGVNLRAAFSLCHAAVPGMLARGYGRIVNISSVSGQTGNFGQTNYAAAKAGLHALTMSLARETAAKGITVNSVSPGYVRTPMTAAMPAEALARTSAAIPVGRLGEPQDIARAVAFLADEASSYITGVNLPVNGGLFMSF
ncbi:3-oxoacyl-ACP reductase [Pseudoxanthomonas composti]|uniref:SDR family oxidoreductase n=1 Tax=Pseudoxanthomonas composti TaxID=2137479 RepID=A0A4Q1JWU6_9GAMM|nr:3-oxoacyl-ACP reductase [Pseudoxanthomonas composti]RXR07085.1 SDR family oxidoreductase [Pseudoxanthomonas composti]